MQWVCENIAILSDHRGHFSALGFSSDAAAAAVSCSLAFCVATASIKILEYSFCLSRMCWYSSTSRKSLLALGFYIFLTRPEYREKTSCACLFCYMTSSDSGSEVGTAAASAVSGFNPAAALISACWASSFCLRASAIACKKRGSTFCLFSPIPRETTAFYCSNCTDSFKYKSSYCLAAVTIGFVSGSIFFRTAWASPWLSNAFLKSCLRY